MITFDQVAKLISQQQAVGETVQRCADAIANGSARPLTDSPGHDTASRLLVDFGIRKASLDRARRVADGIDGVLQTLGALPGADLVLVFHFGSDRHTYSVFVHASSRHVLGCVVLPRALPT